MHLVKLLLDVSVRTWHKGAGHHRLLHEYCGWSQHLQSETTGKRHLDYSSGFGRYLPARQIDQPRPGLSIQI